MIALLPMLAGLGIDFIKDLITDNGEDLVKEGIKKVTGIDLNKKKELTPQEVQAIRDAEVKLRELDYKELALEYEARQKQEEEKTKRWESDNNSDSRIAKMVRPMLVIYLVFVVTIFAILDGNMLGFSIKDVWVTLFTSLAITAVSGYFVLRTYEKRTGTSSWTK